LLEVRLLFGKVLRDVLQPFGDRGVLGAFLYTLAAFDAEVG